MPYLPRLGISILVNRFQLGDYEAHLLEDVESFGEMGYLYVVLVFPAGSDDACFAVAAEHSSLEMLDEPMLGSFNGKGYMHQSHGTSRDWADRDKFLNAAMDLAKVELGLANETQPVVLE